MRKARPADDPDSARTAYARALRWLTARELSEAQVRARLEAAGYTNAAIATALGRLVEDRTIDDRRAALSVARTEALVRRHGPRRVMGRLLSMQIDRELAREVVAELFEADSEAQLLDAALDRRLRGRPERLKDVHERRKVLAYLVRQGYSSGAAMSAIRSKSRQ